MLRNSQEFDYYYLLEGDDLVYLCQGFEANGEQAALLVHLLRSCSSGLARPLTSEHLSPFKVIFSGASFKTSAAQFVHLTSPT